MEVHQGVGVVQHFLDDGVLVCARDVLNDTSDPVGLGPVRVLDESNDLDESFAAGSFVPLCLPAFEYG